MKSCFSRAATAIGIGVSHWSGSIAVLATPQQPQSQTKDQTTAQPQPSSQTNQKSATQAPKQTAANKKPLSTNDDPTMIGKRNINKGIWGKMAAGTEKEVREGRMLAAQVDKEAKFIDDPIITEYVNRVGQNIVLHSDAKVPFTIKVIDSDEVNAFALPGGFFYVNKGLILAADNEAEMAGVMAHEIGHVAARHAVENQTKGTLLEYAALAGSIFLGGWPGLIYQNTAGLLRLSNARASSAGELPGGDNGAPGRPTLKRRQPTPDDSSTPPADGEQKTEKPGAPQLKRPATPNPSPTPQP